MSTDHGPAVNSGLDGIVAAATATSLVDGKKGRLVYRGYDIADLAEHSTYEEVAHLVWCGSLPTRAQLTELEASMAGQRELPAEIERLIGEAPRNAHPMDVLRTAVSALGMYDPDARDNSREANLRKAIRLTAQVPTVVAHFEKLRRGEPAVRPEAGGNLAASFLRMLTGREADPEVARVFDVCLILHTEHGLNASTFSARVTASTLSDMHSAITSAIGTLKGPLHGGANERVMETLVKIGDPARPRRWSTRCWPATSASWVSGTASTGPRTRGRRSSAAIPRRSAGGPATAAGTRSPARSRRPCGPTSPTSTRTSTSTRPPSTT